MRIEAAADGGEEGRLVLGNVSVDALRAVSVVETAQTASEAPPLLRSPPMSLPASASPHPACQASRKRGFQAVRDRRGAVELKVSSLAQEG